MRLVCLTVEAVAAVKELLFTAYGSLERTLDDVSALTVGVAVLSAEHTLLPLQLAYHQVSYMPLDGTDNTVFKKLLVFLIVNIKEHKFSPFIT